MKKINHQPPLFQLPGVNALKRLLYPFMVLLWLGSMGVATAQTQQVSGVVTDASGESIPGVNVIVKGAALQGTITDMHGRYTLQGVGVGAVLEFSFIGFRGHEEAVAGRSVINVVLHEDVLGLDEVVVVGYGTVKKSNVIGSISNIDRKTMADRPITRVEQALQGQMAGVSVRNTTGSPGSDITINVRGAASINGESTPLYVVDGVPTDNLAGINPNDIQSIDVLKDAASAAIYGSRGSNGVVLVTTRRGKTGNPVISLSAYTAISNIERTVDVMTSDQWIEFNKKWYDRQWVNQTGQSADVSQAGRIAYAEATNGRSYQTRDELALIRATYGIYDPYWGTDALESIDWQKELFRLALSSDIQLNASGANDILNYSLSAGIYQQEGIVVGSSYDRYSLRANMEARVNKRIRIGLNISPSYALKKGANVDGKDNAVARSLSFPGWVPAGSGKMAGASPYKFYDQWGPGQNNVSPYVQATENERIGKNVMMNSSLGALVNVADGLNVEGLVAWNLRVNTERQYSPTWIQGSWDTSSPGEKSSSRKTTLNMHTLLTQSTVSYHKEFGVHSFDVLLGTSRETTNQEGTDQGLSGFPDDKTWVFTKDRGTTTNYNTISYTEDAMVSFFSRIQYSFKDRYLFAASIRRDGSSKFGPDNRWGSFPSLSFAWKANEEEFLKHIPWLGTAKVRLSWGVAGNDRIGSSQFVSAMAQLNYPLGDDQSVNNGYVVGNISNSNLGWETTNSYNAGIDFGVFRNRIYLTMDFYVKNTSDLLLKAPVSLTTGFTNMMDNVGSVRNHGFEIEINSANITGKFRWNTSFNLSLNRNEITDLGAENADITLGQGNTIIQRVGHPINSYYLLKADGVLRAADFESDGTTPKPGVAIYSGQKAGDTKWRDVAGADGTGPDGKITSDDYIVAGSFQPDFEWGLTNTFHYKNFDMSVLLQGKVGGDLLSIGSRAWNRPTNDPKWLYMEQWLTKAYWSEEEPGNGKVPAFFSAVTSQYDTNWMYDAGYVRIKNITLGYSIPVNKSLFNNLRVYASCDNVWIWDNYYPGFSPEAATQDNASSDWGAYPLARTFSLGVNITF